MQRSTTIPEAPGVDSRLAAELSRWKSAIPGHSPDTLTLAWLITARIRAVGRHHLGKPLLDALTVIQRRHSGRDRFLDSFLDAVLARHQDTFANPTYLALPLLRLSLDDPDSGLDPVRLSALLIADLIDYERRPESVERLGPRTRTQRARHAGRFVTEAEPSVHMGARTPPGTAAAEWLPLTVLPASRVHDEYTFIRVLQAHELIFPTITGHVRAAAEALRAGRIDRATEAARRADQVFRLATMLFPVLATVRPADFYDFRQYTAGASALQSFTRLPELRPALDDLTRAHAGLDRKAPELAAALAALDRGHRKWMAARHGLAQRLFRLDEERVAA